MGVFSVILQLFVLYVMRVYFTCKKVNVSRYVEMVCYICWNVMMVILWMVMVVLVPVRCRMIINVLVGLQLVHQGVHLQVQLVSVYNQC
jgi:uncharacterized membrane-anchored protein